MQNRNFTYCGIDNFQEGDELLWLYYIHIFMLCFWYSQIPYIENLSKSSKMTNFYQLAVQIGSYTGCFRYPTHNHFKPNWFCKTLLRCVQKSITLIYRKRTTSWIRYASLLGSLALGAFAQDSLPSSKTLKQFLSPEYLGENVSNIILRCITDLLLDFFRCRQLSC
jgi:hypothetical protein